MKCCVPLCGITGDNHSPTVLENQERVIFHHFPTTPWLRKSWLVAIGMKECDLPQEAVVCSQHFVGEDYTVTTSGDTKLRNNSVPSVFTVPITESSNFDYCVICLDTGVSKLFLLHRNRLAKAYTNVTGCELDTIRDYVKTVPKLCTECAQRLINCNAFREKTLRAQSILSQMFQKDKTITLQRLKSVNRIGNQLISNMVKHTFEPDHCNLHVIHDEQENRTLKQESIISNIEVVIEKTHEEENVISKLEGNSNIKSEKSDVTTSESENDVNDCETDDLSELDDIYDSVQGVNNNQRFKAGDKKHMEVKDNHFKINNKDLNRNDVRNAGTTDSGGQKNKYKFNDDYDDDSRLRDDDIKNADKSKKSKVKNKNGNVSMNCEDDNESDLDLDTDNIDNEIDSDIDDIDHDIDHDIDDDGELDIDIDHEADELTNINISNDRLLNKVGNDSENKVSLNNVILFVKDTRPIIQHKDSIPGNSITHQNLSKTRKKTIKKIVMQRNKTMKPNNNKIIIKQNSNKNKNGSNIKNEDKLMQRKLRAMKFINKKLRLLAPKKTEQYLRYKNKTVRNPNTQDCTDIGLKLFSRTTYNYEEQVADIQNRKNTEKYLTAPYKCDICFESFAQLHSHTYHMHKHTNKFGPFECGICGVHCKTRTRLTRHLLRHSVKFSCKQCKFTTNAKKVAQAHEHSHEGITYKCKHCDAVFRSRSGYFLHIRIKHTSDHACPLCGYNFISPAGVRYHISLKHPSQDVQNLSGPTCEECNIHFASDAAYQRHREVSPKHAVGGRKPKRNDPYTSQKARKTQRPCDQPRDKPRDKILCEICGQGFNCAAKLRQHNLKHTGEKLFKCEICGKGFIYTVSYKMHMQRHSNTLPRYPCDVCDKDFSSLSNRQKHMQTHLASRPVHTCDACNKTFTSALGLTQHTLHVHLNVPWPKRNRRDRHRPET